MDLTWDEGVWFVAGALITLGLTLFLKGAAKLWDRSHESKR